MLIGSSRRKIRNIYIELKILAFVAQRFKGDELEIFVK